MKTVCRKGVLLTTISGLLLILISWQMGKIPLFLLLNTDLGTAGDWFFRIWTNMGDGFVWVPVAVIFWFKRKNQFPLLIAAILISTVITQVTKNYIIPAEPRPTAAIADQGLIHTVNGVELHTAYSFPSGHTATAFTVFLLLCLMINRTWVLPAGYLYALLVGYSRIYLAQHFPLDVGAGMLVAVITIFLSMAVQRQWENRNKKSS
jgi:membrane-associated phospholipid phosphatase